jgi:hypothetical protein
VREGETAVRPGRLLAWCLFVSVFMAGGPERWGGSAPFPFSISVCDLPHSSSVSQVEDAHRFVALYCFMPRISTALAVLFLAKLTFAQQLADLKTTVPVKPGHPLILGFLGAFEKWDDDRRSVRILAHDLEKTRGWNVETFSHRNRGTALKFVMQALDRNRDGRLDERERTSTPIVLYGQSMGGGAVSKLAHELERLGIPVLLSVQVDSFGKGDGWVSPNVRFAANFYQRELFTVRGETKIQAEDPTRTTILMNERRDYGFFTPAPDRNLIRGYLGGGHMKMEGDPAVWQDVESLIRKALAGQLH